MVKIHSRRLMVLIVIIAGSITTAAAQPTVDPKTQQPFAVPERQGGCLMTVTQGMEDQQAASDLFRKAQQYLTERRYLQAHELIKRTENLYANAKAAYHQLAVRFYDCTSENLQFAETHQQQVTEMQLMASQFIPEIDCAEQLNSVNDDVLAASLAFHEKNDLTASQAHIDEAMKALKRVKQSDQCATPQGQELLTSQTATADEFASSLAEYTQANQCREQYYRLRDTVDQLVLTPVTDEARLSTTMDELQHTRTQVQQQINHCQMQTEAYQALLPDLNQAISRLDQYQQS